MCIYHNLFPTRESDAFCPDITPLELLSSLFQSHELHLIRKRCPTRIGTHGFDYTEVLCPRTTVKHNLRDGPNEVIEHEFECAQCQAIIESGGWKGRTFDEIVKANNNFQPLSNTSVAASHLTDSDMEESVCGEDSDVEYGGDDAISFKTEPSSAEESVAEDLGAPNDDQKIASDEEPDKADPPQSPIHTGMKADNAVPSQINEAGLSSSPHETAKDKGKATMRKRSVDKEANVGEQYPKRQKRRSTSPNQRQLRRRSLRSFHARSPSHKSGIGLRSANGKPGKAPARRSRGYSSGSTLIEISSDSDDGTYGNAASESGTERASTSVKPTSTRQAQETTSYVRAREGDLSQRDELQVESLVDKSHFTSAYTQMVNSTACTELEKAFNTTNAGVESEEVIRMAVKDGSFTKALEAMMNVESQASGAYQSNTHRLREINAEITNQLAAVLEESVQGKKREANLATQLAVERRNNLDSGLETDTGLSSADQDISLHELTKLRQKVTDLTRTLENPTNETSDTNIKTKKLEAIIQELKDKLALRDTTNETVHEGPILDHIREENELLNTQIKKLENDMALTEARAATNIKQVSDVNDLQQQNIALKKDLMRLEAEKNDALTRDANSAQGNIVLKAKIARLERLLRPVQTQQH